MFLPPPFSPSCFKELTAVLPLVLHSTQSGFYFGLICKLFFSQSPMVLVYFVVYTREDGSDLGVSQQKVFISPLATTLGILDPSVALSLSQGQLLGTKPCSGLTYFS